MSNSGTLFNIEHGSFVDGPGIRTVVFFKGCLLRCAWCHNPESQSFLPEKMVYRHLCIGCGRCKTVCPSPDHCTLCGKCAAVCPRNAIRIMGKTWTVDEVMAEITEDKDFYAPDGGVTFSGGECLLQPAFLRELLARCRKAGISTAVDTAGDVPWETLAAILPDTDLFLYDIKLLDSEKHRAFTGVANERILENYRRLIASGARVIVRMPVIPGVNEEDAAKLPAFFNENGWPEQCELLPYHRLGENKYPALSREGQTFDVPEKTVMEELKKNLEVNRPC